MCNTKLKFDQSKKSSYLKEDFQSLRDYSSPKCSLFLKNKTPKKEYCVSHRPEEKRASNVKYKKSSIVSDTLKNEVDEELKEEISPLFIEDTEKGGSSPDSNIHCSPKICWDNVSAQETNNNSNSTPKQRKHRKHRETSHMFQQEKKLSLYHIPKTRISSLSLHDDAHASARSSKIVYDGDMDFNEFDRHLIKKTQQKYEKNNNYSRKAPRNQYSKNIHRKTSKRKKLNERQIPKSGDLDL